MRTTKNIALIILVLAAITIGRAANQYISNAQKLKIAEMAINEYYVDTVNEDKLVEDAIKGMLDELDPHSSYTNSEETRELTEPLEGNFSGVGIQFNMKEDTLYIIQTIAGGPSERVGLVAGDRIIAVDDTIIAGVKMKNSRIMKLLRGKKGTKVNVTVKRRGEPEPMVFRITRDDIPLYSVDASYMLDRRTGYVRVSRFAQTTHDEFMKAVDELKNEGMKQLIIDLSDNGGGYLHIAAAMVNEFLSKDQMIVYTEGRRSPRHEESANGKGSLKDLDIVVCVNQYSASASEIFAGAIQDWDRGVVVGRRTFGKGLVQRPFPFPDGSMIRLTVARYYTPSGRCIQKPYTDGREEYELEIYNRYRSGEYLSADSIHFADSLKYTTLNNRRTIYGGGGIMPDCFVPLDTTEYSDYYSKIIAKGILNQYVINYVDKNRKQLLNDYKDINAFSAGFEVDSLIVAGLVAEATADSIEYNAKDFNTSQNLMKYAIKALIARDIYDNEAYFRIMNHRNDIVNEAKAIINDKKRFNKLLGRN